MGKDIDLKTIAKQTVGLAGADLGKRDERSRNLCCQARPENHCTAGYCRCCGESDNRRREKKSRKLSERDKLVTAYHEVGHAIVGHLCKESDPSTKSPLFRAVWRSVSMVPAERGSGTPPQDQVLR